MRVVKARQRVIFCGGGLHVCGCAQPAAVVQQRQPATCDFTCLGTASPFFALAPRVLFPACLLHLASPPPVPVLVHPITELWACLLRRAPHSCHAAHAMPHGTVPSPLVLAAFTGPALSVRTKQALHASWALPLRRSVSPYPASFPVRTKQRSGFFCTMCS